MNEIATEFRDAHVRAKSFCCDSPSAAGLGHCDVIVFAASEQERCCEIVRSPFYSAKRVLIVGEERGKTTTCANLSQLHRNKLIEYAGESYHPIRFGTSQRDAAETLKRLLSEVVQIYGEVQRPLDVGLDLTCCPIFHALGLLAFMVNRGLARRFSIFYAEGEYPEETVEEDRHELFTAGEWEAVAIPGLQNPWIPRPIRLYLVAIGFEGNKTLRLCERREPDRIAVLFPDPGVRADYVDRTLKNNQPLIDRFSVSESNILRANAADAVEAWKLMAMQNVEKFHESTVEYLCCGTKPHSLGIALRALTAKEGVVSDIAADTKLPANVKAAGIYWRYDIWDLSAL